MNAFRFLSLLTVGFALLVLIFLLNATQGRMEAEAVRVLEGPEVSLAAGSEAVWELRLGGFRVEDAWPAAQRQPHVFLALGDGAALLDGLTFSAEALYERSDGSSAVAWVSGKTAEGALPRPEGGLVDLGPLWMSWDLPLRLAVRVEGDATAAGGTARLLMKGEPSVDYIAARSMARTLWFVFTAIAAAGFAGLLVTMTGPAGGGPPSDRAGKSGLTPPAERP